MLISILLLIVILYYISMVTLLFFFFPFIIFSVDVADDVISIFDTGPGMDGSDENSIVKWYLIFLEPFYVFSF